MRFTFLIKNPNSPRTKPLRVSVEGNTKQEAGIKLKSILKKIKDKNGYLRNNS